jgi:hypothetical protein
MATPSIVSKVYAQNSSGSTSTKLNNTGGERASPKELMACGMLTTKDASSSSSKFIGSAQLNQSGSNASSANNSSSTKE